MRNGIFTVMSVNKDAIVISNSGPPKVNSWAIRALKKKNPCMIWQPSGCSHSPQWALSNFSQFSFVQLFSHVWLFATPWTAACQASLSVTDSQRLLNSCSSSRWCHPTISSCHSLLFLPSVFPSIRVFSSESVFCFRWPKYWSFGFSISPANEYSGLISFRMDWLDLLAVQGTLKSILQHHNSKASWGIEDVKNAEYRPQIAEMHMKAMSPKMCMHLPIHRKALNSSTRDVWFSLINNNLSS